MSQAGEARVTKQQEARQKLKVLQRREEILAKKPPARLTVSTGLAKVGISYSSTNVSRGMYYARNPVPPGVEQEGSAGGIEVDDSTVGEGSDSDHGEEDDGSNTEWSRLSSGQAEANDLDDYQTDDAFKAECLAGLDAALKPRDSAARSESVADSEASGSESGTILSSEPPAVRPSTPVSVAGTNGIGDDGGGHGVPKGNDGGNEWSWKEDVAVLTSHAKVVETVESKEQFWNDVLICFKETMGTTTRTHNAVKFRFTKYLKHNRHLYQGALQG